MNRLAAALEGAKQYAPVNYVRIDGGTDQEDRSVCAVGGRGIAAWLGFRMSDECEAAPPFVSRSGLAVLPTPGRSWCRRQAVRRFHSDSAVRVALLSVTAAGVGLDFSAASVVVFAGAPALASTS